RKLGWHRGYRYHATKQEEVADIQRELGEKVEVLMVENLPRKAAEAPPAVISKQPGELRLVHVARISPEKNLDYALKVLGKLSGKVRFDVYGPVYNAAYWEQCQEIIAGLPPNIEVVHHGSVNSGAVMEVVSASHAMLMPTRGENYGHIIIESLLAGRPVVISDQTPWRQLAAQRIGWDLSLNDPDAFVRVLQELVDMPAEPFGAYAAAAHAFARKEVARPGLVAGYHALFERPTQ
ncbi:MAG: glycosyltransferase, partial [Bacteroidota bacterium]